MTAFRVKPHFVPLVAEEIEQLAKSKVVISIAAGVTLGALKQWLPQSQVIRVMPNTPAQLGVGMLALLFDSEVSAHNRRQISSMMEVLGRTIIMPDEKLMDVFTALAGSGPAFFLYPFLIY